MSAAEWPADSRLQARSLSTLLSKLDREQELDWLRDRPDVQGLLARLLKCSVAEVGGQVAGRPTGPPERLLRWSDLRFARTLDLSEEALPPGIPSIARDPTRWSRSFWLAPAGSGRSLAGRWLASRGLARFVHARQASELPRTADPSVALFVELEALDPGAELALPHDRVLVAAPTAPRDRRWTVERAPAPSEYLGELVGWVAERLPPDSGFEPDAALEWLRAGPLASGELDSFGSALGLIGLLDELGMREAERRGLHDLAERFVRRRIDETFGREGADASWLRRNAFDVLVGMARKSLTDSERPWTDARSLDEWLALVPDEHKTGLDVEWLRVSLARVDTSIRPSDVERAARRVSPGAFRIVRGLRQARLLAQDEDADRLTPAPRWLAGVVSVVARRRLLDGSAFEWGEGVLRPHAAAELVRALMARITGGDSAPLTDVVELEADENPAHVAAVEAAFRAAGLARLEGAELDPELVEDLWADQMRLVLVLDGELPRPRIDHLPQPDEALLERGSWYAAALSLGEALASEQRVKASLFAPWGGDAPPPALPAVYDQIALAAAKARAAGERFGFEAIALVDRLRQDVGSARSDAPHPLELPGIVLDEALHGVLAWARLESSDLESLLWLHRRRGSSDLAPLASGLWNAWREGGQPALTGSVLDPARDEALSLFQFVPAELVASVLAGVGDVARALAALGETGWAALFEHWRTAAPEPELATHAAAHVPRALAPGALELFQGREARAQLWQRFPELVAEQLRVELASGQLGRALGLASAAPAGIAAGVLATLGDQSVLDRLEARERDTLRGLLHDLVMRRAAGWRDAYALLIRLER